MDDIVAFSAGVPSNYHEHMGRMFFAPYAEVMSDRAARLGSGRILETACGTGILTRALAQRMPERAIVASDLNEEMLAVARTTLEGTKNVELHTADMCRLPFSEHEFDLVACQFGLMFVPDKLQAANEARRVLVSGGRWLVATWAAKATQRSVEIVDDVVRRFFPEDPPTFWDTPFSIPEPAMLERIYSDAGFTDIRVERVSAKGTTPNARSLATGLLLGTPMSAFLRARDASRIPELVDRAERALVTHFGSGPITDPMEALIAIGTAP